MNIVKNVFNNNDFLKKLSYRFYVHIQLRTTTIQSKCNHVRKINTFLIQNSLA